MYSAYKLNKQGDNIERWCTPFAIWNQSVVPCPILTGASWPAYRFLRRQVRWAGISISFRIFHSLLWSFLYTLYLTQQYILLVLLKKSIIKYDYVIILLLQLRIKPPPSWSRSLLSSLSSFTYSFTSKVILHPQASLLVCTFCPCNSIPSNGFPQNAGKIFVCALILTSSPSIFSQNLLFWQQWP